MSEYVEDGTSDWGLGQDAWHHPDRIQDNQYASGVNVTTKGGVIAPRAGYWEVELDFDDDKIKNGYGEERTIKEVWESGKFQALIPYRLNSQSRLVSVICGHVFLTDLPTMRTRRLTKEFRLSQYSSRINWASAGNKIVLFDFPDYPVVIDGEKIFRCDPRHEIAGQSAPQIPISTLGTFNQNRLFIANDGVEFTAGDAVGNNLTPEAPITFTEVFTPSSPYVNQFFSLPIEEQMYPISAMGFIQSPDSGTGIGPMYIATEKKVYFYNVNQPRSNWATANFGQVLLANAGIAGPRAVVNVNSDILFLSGLGKLHALSTTRDAAKRWGNVSISREVENYLKFDDIELKEFAVLGTYLNKIYTSCNPYRVPALDLDRNEVTDYAHAGFIVLELDNLSSFLTDGVPSWAGLWTGINPMDMATIDDDCFVISKDGCSEIGGRNVLYQINEAATYDVIKNKKRRVQGIVYTKLYNCKKEFDQKKEHTIAMHLQDLSGTIDLRIERKPTHSNKWLEYARWHHEAPSKTFDMPEDSMVNGTDFQEFKQLMFGDAIEEGCNPITQDEYVTGRAVQYRLTLAAESWALENFKIKMELRPFKEMQDEVLCEKLPILRLPAQKVPDWYIFEEAGECEEKS